MFQQKQYRDKSLINFNKNYFFTNEMNFIIKRIYIMSISGNLALHIYPLIGKLRRYFFSRKIFKPELPKEKYKHLKRNKENFKVKEDGTYDMQ